MKSISVLVYLLLFIVGSCFILFEVNTSFLFQKTATTQAHVLYTKRVLANVAEHYRTSVYYSYEVDGVYRIAYKRLKKSLPHPTIGDKIELEYLVSNPKIVVFNAIYEADFQHELSYLKETRDTYETIDFRNGIYHYKNEGENGEDAYGSYEISGDTIIVAPYFSKVEKYLMKKNANKEDVLLNLMSAKLFHLSDL